MRSTSSLLSIPARAAFSRAALSPAVFAVCGVLAACQQDLATAPSVRSTNGPSMVVGTPTPGSGSSVPTLAPIVLPSDPIALTGGSVPVVVSTSFTDSGGNGTYTATLTCGDGTTSPVGVTTTTATSGTASGTCTYTAPGVYHVSLTVTDSNGGSTTQTPQTYIVVYEPGVGFVTGGGWIASPGGAYAADPSLAGRANFGFVAKYQNGAWVPTGQTEFQFQLGRLNFHSTSYQWLVVSNGRAQYKGQGTINGSGDYRFIITAIDGRVAGTGQDQFRIKISDASGAVVYDNQMSQSETSSSASDLTNGSITVHK